MKKGKEGEIEILRRGEKRKIEKIFLFGKFLFIVELKADL